MNRIDHKNSLGVLVIRYVLGIYTVITILITAFLLLSEYNSIKKRVIDNIVLIEETFYDTFAEAMWQLNRIQIKSILSGLVQGDGVVGLRFVHPEKDEFAKIGVHATPETIKNEIKQDAKGRNIIKGNLYEVDLLGGNFFNRLIEVRFHLYRKNHIKENPPIYVGIGSIFSSNKVILEKVQHGFYLIIVSSIIKTIVLWFLFYIIITHLVSKPLSRLTSSILMIDHTRPQSDPLLESIGKRKDELGIFAHAFSNMIVSIHDNIEMINDLNATLEKKVEQRTFELASKNKDIESMLANIKQGIFTFDHSVKIQSQYSKYLESIFETNQIAGADPVEFLFKNAKLSKNDIDQVKMIVKSCVGLDEFAFSVNAHLLVKEYQLGNKVLELDWGPILDHDNVTIVKVMVVVRDVTELRKLQAEIDKSNLELSKIGQILNIGAEKYIDFAKRTMEFINENKNILAKGEKNISVLFRNLHTIKGNARTLQLTEFVNCVHDVEQFYQNIRDNKTAWDQAKMEKDLLKVEEELTLYNDLLTTKLKMTKTHENDQLALFIDEKLEKNELTIDDIRKFRLMSRFDSLKSILSDEVKAIADIAKSMSKSIPNIIFNESATVSKKYSGILKDIFSHLFRNNIDHGIENSDERIKLGKNSKGNISVSTEVQNNQFIIKLCDDGKGLNIEALKKKSGREMTDLEYANLIFESGVSTAQKVTDISGRGVGMDAVKSFIEKLGGSIEIHFTDIVINSGHRSFEFIIKLPGDFASV